MTIQLNNSLMQESISYNPNREMHGKKQKGLLRIQSIHQNTKEHQKYTFLQRIMVYGTDRRLFTHFTAILLMIIACFCYCYHSLFSHNTNQQNMPPLHCGFSPKYAIISTLILLLFKHIRCHFTVQKYVTQNTKNVCKCIDDIPSLEL